MKKKLILAATLILTILMIWYKVNYYLPIFRDVYEILTFSSNTYEKPCNKPHSNKINKKNFKNGKVVVKKDFINIALFGLDAREVKYPSRSDSIIVVSIDTKMKNVKIISLMRDMYVSIPGKRDNRINAAYAFGGPELALRTINKNFGLNIKDYITVNFGGLEKIIDKMGGVSINISKEEIPILNSSMDEKSLLILKPGLQRLNGKQAVTYARIRHVGNGDYQRTQRQRAILNEIYKKAKAQSITDLIKMIYQLNLYIKTNLNSKEIIEIALIAKGFKLNKLLEYRLPADNTYRCCTIRGMSVLVPDMNKNKRLIYEYINKN